LGFARKIQYFVTSRLRVAHMLLRSQIKDGTITKRLPSVKTLSQEHGVSHITAERPLTTLKDQGLITPVIGKGYYIAGT